MATNRSTPQLQHKATDNVLDELFGLDTQWGSGTAITTNNTQWDSGTTGTNNNPWGVTTSAVPPANNNPFAMGGAVGGGVSNNPWGTSGG